MKLSWYSLNFELLGIQFSVTLDKTEDLKLLTKIIQIWTVKSIKVKKFNTEWSNYYQDSKKSFQSSIIWY